MRSATSFARGAGRRAVGSSMGSAKPASDASKGSSQSASKGSSQWTEPSLPAADALAAAMESEALPPPALCAKLGDKAWATRLEGAAELLACVQALPEAQRQPLHAELLLWQLEKVMRLEKNVQVASKLLEAGAAVVAAVELVARGSATRLVECAVERLAVKQTKRAAAEALLGVGEACSAAWLLAQVRTRSESQKSPKVLMEALLFARECLEAFSVPAAPQQQLIEFGVGAADHRDAGVREAAQGVLLGVCAVAGAAVLSSPLLAPLKDSFRKQLQAESAKLPQSAPSPPSRRWRHERAPNASRALPSSKAAGASSKAATKATALKAQVEEEDGVFPRVDLVKDVLSAQTLAGLKSSQWKERQAALAALSKALDENPRLSPGVGGLIEALKARLGDNQSTIALAALNALGALAQGVGKSIRIHAKLALAEMLQCFGDGKPQVRDAAAAALEKWIAEMAVEPLLPFLPRALAIESPLGRAKVMEWLTRYVATLEPQEPALKPLLPALLRNLDDRTPEVRNAAFALIEALLVAGLPISLFEELLQKSSKATISKLRPVLQRLQLAGASLSQSGLAMEPAAADVAPSATVEPRAGLQRANSVGVKSALTQRPARVAHAASFGRLPAKSAASAAASRTHSAATQSTATGAVSGASLPVEKAEVAPVPMAAVGTASARPVVPPLGLANGLAKGAPKNEPPKQPAPAQKAPEDVSSGGASFPGSPIVRAATAPLTPNAKLARHVETLGSLQVPAVAQLSLPFPGLKHCQPSRECEPLPWFRRAMKRSPRPSAG